MKNTAEDNHPLKLELYKLFGENTSYFEFIQNGLLDGIWYWDLEEPERIWMSPQFWETLGYDPQEMRHKTSEWKDIIFADDLKISTENFHKHLKDERNPFDQIVRYRHKNGSTVWVRCRGVSIRDENGKATRMLGAHNDLTTIMTLQKEMAEKIEVRALNEKLHKKEVTEMRVHENVFYNKKSKTLRHNEQVVSLTDQEISLFELFLNNKNQILSINAIEYMLNPNRHLSSNALALSVSRLRKKLPMVNIKTAYGQGYLLVTE